MTTTLARLAKDEVTPSDMHVAMEQILSSQAPVEDVKQFLQTLAERGESDKEIAAVVASLWEHQAVHFTSPLSGLCDTCGTGGDGKSTFNISTLAGIVAAACDVRICKHGNRAASSQCGSADVLEELGLNLNATPEQIVRSIEKVGFGFCFAPKFHPAMKAVAEIRRSLGIRTIFNFAGPLANPAKQGLWFQLVGVSDKKRMESMAKALLRLGIHRGLVVHSKDGLDEVTTTGETVVVEIRSGKTLHVSPVHFGLARTTLNALRGGDVATNAEIARKVLSGNGSLSQREIVAFNAGCAIYTVKGPVGEGEEGIKRGIKNGIDEAIEVLKTDRAWKVLEGAIKISHDSG